MLFIYTLTRNSLYGGYIIWKACIMMVECKTFNEKAVFLSRGRTSEDFIFKYICLYPLTATYIHIIL